MAPQVRVRPDHLRTDRWWVSAAWKRTVGAVGSVLQVLWRIRLGWATGHVFLLLTHIGRHIGKRYRTVLYVQRYDRRMREATVISVWGNSQWFRNISATPAAQVQIGLQRYEPHWDSHRARPG